MMVHSYSRKAHLALGLLVVAAATPNTLKASQDNFKEAAWGMAMIGGAVAAAGIGAYALYSWLTPSDEEVLQGAQRELANFSFNQYPYINDLNNLLGGFPTTLYAQDKLIAILNEPILYQIAYTYGQNGSVVTKIDELSEQISRFKEKHATLRERIAYIEQNNNPYDKQFIKNEMVRVSADIARVLEQLMFAHRYLANHRSYFALINVEYRLYKGYAQELEVLPYVYNNWDLARSLHPIILSKQAGMRFPYKNYVELIERHSKELDYAISTVSYNYSERLGYARDLSRKLSSIKMAVLSDVAYAQDIQAYENEKIAQAQLALQQQKLELMQQQVLLAQQQAQALREQTKLKKAELRRVEPINNDEVSITIAGSFKI